MKKLVELDAALEGLENLNAISFYEANEHSKEAYAETKDMLKALPTVDAAQLRHGRWIYHIDDLFPAESTQECDQCHEEQPLTCGDNFCPNCGAKMTGKGGDT